jgi:2-methylcitrate dehydratase PrpD
VFAALLAREGFTANEAILEHEHGYARVFNHDAGIDLTPLGRWGNPLEILTDYGLALKPYPSGGATHPAIEAALQVREALRPGVAAFPLSAIRSVRVGVPERAFDELALGIVVPRSPLEAKFSMPFCVAAALAEGAVTLATFDATPLVSEAVGALIAKIEMVVDDRVRHDTEFATYVTCTTADGRTVERHVPLALGKPARWFSEERLRAKFMECGGRALPTDRLEPLFAHLLALDGPEPPRAAIEGLRLGARR